MNDENLISKNIKKLRKERGLTQTELAQLTGLSMSAIRSYENGLREPNSKAMVALERFFHVSGEDLRGKTDTPLSEYIWQDPEVMKAVSESFPTLINKLLDSAKQNSDVEQKMIFDILVELCHISSLQSITTDFKTSSFLLVEETLALTTRFIDFFNRTISSEFEQNRIEKYIESCVNDYKKALINFQDSIRNTQ